MSSYLAVSLRGRIGMTILYVRGYMKLYCTDVTLPELTVFRQRVSEERMKRMERYRFEIDRRRGLAAEALLNYGLRKLCPALSVPVSLSRDENGKPSVIFSEKERILLKEAGLLLPSEDTVAFSLSHAGNYALCAISQEHGAIGADLEEQRRDNRKIAEHFFCPGEIAAIRSTGVFYDYWTLKESFLKAVGQGLSLPLDSFEVLLGENGKDARYLQDFDQKRYEGRLYPVLPGYSIAVCAEAPASFPEDITFVTF